MEAFQNLIQSKAVDVSPLTTHVFKIEDAASAYDMILEKRERYLGILIQYDHQRGLEVQRVRVSLVPILGVQSKRWESGSSARDPMPRVICCRIYPRTRELL